MASWDLLDFAVVAPAASLGLPYGLLGLADGSDDHTTEAPLEVSVAVGPRLEGDPGWVVTTRRRRGIRLDSRTSLDYLTLDIDLPGAGTDAVRQLLIHTLPPGLSHQEVMAEVDAAQRVSSQIGAGLTLASVHPGRWQRERMHLDADVFAVWVYRQESRWAAVADVGYATVTMFGRVEPPAWNFTALTPQRAGVRLGHS